MTARTLVLGGARSGKSAHAEGLVSSADEVDYVATARVDATDTEWSARVEQHRARRPEHWRTREVPDPAALSASLSTSETTVLVDDMATWLTNALDDTAAWDRDERALHQIALYREELATAVRTSPANLVLVSAEVGLGVIPSTRSGRLFRDELGALNARLAAECTNVLLLVAGMPLRLR